MRIDAIKNGKVYRVFNKESDLPDEETIEEMEESGYILYVGGEPYNKPKE